jgi:hypothetical protein
MATRRFLKIAHFYGIVSMKHLLSFPVEARRTRNFKARRSLLLYVHSVIDISQRSNEAMNKENICALEVMSEILLIQTNFLYRIKSGVSQFLPFIKFKD